jgi:hypothetical protein
MSLSDVIEIKGNSQERYTFSTNQNECGGFESPCYRVVVV